MLNFIVTTKRIGKENEIKKSILSKKDKQVFLESNKINHYSNHSLMAVSIITTEDLEVFKIDLLKEFKTILENQTTVKPQKWLRSTEVRQLLNISNGTLQNLRINGTLSYTKVGGIMYYSYTDIEKLLEVNKVQALPTLFK